MSMSKAASPICVNYFLMTIPWSMSYWAILGLNLSTVQIQEPSIVK
ncbi:uncharacterized protein RSE6_05775 [Rhynchosporium secalis]|uniref:Uncharacterized protein n=1 Tax=Rhynchosporium secalis TaxID=38038 RepID=A0A1E1M8N4_RHYSE|nr:uncharacterized protein RSE6_05775 [Rhynchosporium secalis]